MADRASPDVVGGGPSDDEHPPEVEFLDGVELGHVELAERALPPWFGWGAAAAAGLALVIAAAIVGLTLDDGDDGAAEAASPTTTAAPTTTLAPPTTLPPASADLGFTESELPGLRPDATLTGVSAERGEVIAIDLRTGQSLVLRASELTEGSRLEQVDGRFGVLMRGRFHSIDADGDLVALTERVDAVHPAFGPGGVVTVVRDGDGQLARIIGLDGVFRGGVRLPGEATVHGAIGGEVVVGLGGRVYLSGPDREAAVDLAPGRVLAVGEEVLVRVVCDLFGCAVVSGPLDDLERNTVPVPDLVAARNPRTWGVDAEVSPDGTKVAFVIVHGDGTVRGVMNIDLETGDAAHSPETAPEIGNFAWAPDSRFLVYRFSDDLMVWDTESLPGRVPSQRIQVDVFMDDIVLR